MSTPIADMPELWRARAPESTLPPQLIERIPLVPQAKSLHGPLTRRRLRRFYGLLAAVYLLGITPVLMSASPAWKAFGLGLLFPGAGFLYSGGALGVLFAVASAALFTVITFYWWARGIVLAPPGVLVLTAALSAWWVGAGPGVGWTEWAIPVAVAGLHAQLMLGRRRNFQRGLARAEAHNAAITKASPLLRDYPVTAAPEMPAGQIKEFRRMLDLALQPVDSWNGFAMNDTWQDGALRYQICTMSWNLAYGQYTQLPAFHGYLNRAQEHLIKKHVDRKTWNYWYWESLWGNLRPDKDPVHIDNIMLSGFLGVSLGLFETASGTSPFAGAGSLPFRWDETTAFPQSHRTLLEQVVKNSKRYDYGWFPCEPHWIYSMCNLVGRNALALHDARHGTDFVRQVGATFDRTMDEEMTLADGRIRVCTSSLFGFTVPSLSGLFGETWGIRFLTPHAPQVAERLWQILKRDFISRDSRGGLNFKLLPLGWDTRRPANFAKWPELNPLIMVLWAALEMGDEEIVGAVRKTIDERYGEGMADSMTWSGRNTMRNMVNKGLPAAWAKGPILADAVYPEAIVTRAVSDGAALDLVLQPGSEVSTTRLTLGRLVPRRQYRVLQTNSLLLAGADGTCTFDVNLPGRTELSVVPVA